jgi:hypothetical protein
MTGRRVGSGLALPACAAAWTLVACNGLLGNRDATPEDGDAGAVPDASTDGSLGDSSSPPGDATNPTRDAAADGSPDASTGDAPAQEAGVDASCFVATAYTVLACDPLGPSSVAVDSANVYWVDGSNVEGCPKAGCGGSPRVYYGGGGAITTVAWAPSANLLYWADAAGSSVSFCALPACLAAKTIGSIVGPQRIAFDATTAYWTLQGGGIDTCAIGTVCAPPMPLVSSGGPFALALGGSNLYYTSGSVLAYCALSSCPLGGYFNQFVVGPDDVAADPSGLPVCVTVPSSTTPMTGEVDCIFSLGTTAAPQRIVGGLPDPRFVALDTTYVYWIDDVADALYRCPIRSPCGSPQLLASFPAQPGTFAVDTSAIYGAVGGTSGFVYSLAKPP